jgi:hypothetical protein
VTHSQPGTLMAHDCAYKPYLCCPGSHACLDICISCWGELCNLSAAIESACLCDSQLNFGCCRVHLLQAAALQHSPQRLPAT